jgi:hypothetical protein
MRSIWFNWASILVRHVHEYDWHFWSFAQPCRFEKFAQILNSALIDQRLPPFESYQKGWVPARSVVLLREAVSHCKVIAPPWRQEEHCVLLEAPWRDLRQVQEHASR